MNATWPSVFGAVRQDETSDFTNDVIKVASLATVCRRKCICMHRVTCPNNRVTSIANCAQQWSQSRFDLVGAHSSDQCQATRYARRVQYLAQRKHKISRRIGPDFATDGVANTTQKLDMCAVELASALTNPQHVRRTVIPVARERVLAGERLFVSKQQSLVACVEINFMQCTVAFGVDTACTHKCERSFNFTRNLLIALTFGARRHKFLVPCMHAIQVGKASLGERAQQVKRAC